MADSDSENEGILNNIQRLVIRPPGHTGKAKKGHICFDGGFETMNLGRVDFITNQEYDLFIRPDTANPRCRYLIIILAFFLQIWGRFNLIILHKILFISFQRISDFGFILLLRIRKRIKGLFSMLSTLANYVLCSLMD